MFDRTSSEFDPDTLAQLLTDLGRKKFKSETRFRMAVGNGAVTLMGDPEAVEWAKGVVKKMKVN